MSFPWVLKNICNIGLISSRKKTKNTEEFGSIKICKIILEVPWKHCNRPADLGDLLVLIRVQIFFHSFMYFQIIVKSFIFIQIMSLILNFVNIEFETFEDVPCELQDMSKPCEPQVQSGFTMVVLCRTTLHFIFN